MERRSHWQAVYQSKRPDQVSWYQPHARRSLALIRQVAPETTAAILDVGGGASTLVDDLIAAGYAQVTVLDVSAAALAQSRERLGTSAQQVRWLEADVLDAQLADAGIDVWHDRAVFHFLTDPNDRRRYVEQVRHALVPRGHVVIATFAEDGPTRCSGLEVQRYSPASLQDVFGAGFERVHDEREVHVTPAGGEQAFTYCVLRLRQR